MQTALNNRIGHYYYRARFCAAHLGRFCSRDPIGYVGSRSNLYEYVKGNAPRMVDPSGLMFWGCDGWVVGPWGPYVSAPNSSTGMCAYYRIQISRQTIGFG